MEALLRACSHASEYPKNMVSTNFYYPHQLDAYWKRFDERSTSMLCEKQNTNLDFWQCDNNGQNFCLKQAQSLEDVREHLELSARKKGYDPISQFIFVQAPHSRERLNVSREVLQYILSYHQVMPAFLDFLFSFGKQEYATDFHYMGIRWEHRLEDCKLSLSVPQLNRSGRSVQSSYSLRGVESTKEENLPWSIRQTAIFQSFDFESNQATWIVVKAGRQMKDRIMSATSHDAPKNCTAFEDTSAGFASCLAMHEIIAEWASQDWRWYINDLERSVQEASRESLYESVFGEPIPGIQRHPSAMTSAKSRNRLLRKFFKAPRRTQTQNSLSDQQPLASPRDSDRMSMDLMSPSRSSDTISFANIRQIEFLQEKVNEALLVLNSNVTVLKGLLHHFDTAIRSSRCADMAALSSRNGFEHFASRITSIENELEIQQTRLQTLRQLLADRKDLLHGDLQYRTTQASYHLTDEAQQSASRMERMTQEMHQIAEKTKKETVVMRIITVVTLIFLPGTFISTLMSTDIVSFGTNDSTSSGQKHGTFSKAAFELYLKITIPLMVCTFILAYGAFKWLSSMDKNRRNEDEWQNSPEAKV